ncbi:hypothetical protein ACFYVM_29470 [Streptomyces sp. NPDC003280]|uniref:hypothetical protein n=1 Tax=Streptomyces sp. NPDC003280 TaxID=3364680 RepID=UPI0036CAED01
MTDRDWDDDGGCENAVEQAERTTRIGWAAIAGVTGLLGVGVIAVVVVCVAVVIGMGYVVVAVP